MSLESRFSLSTKKSRMALSGCLIAILVPIALIGAINMGFFSSASSPSVLFTSPVNLSADTYQAHYPWVVSTGSNVYVSWTEEAHGIYIRASSDNGMTWSPSMPASALRLSPRGGTTSYPVMGVNGSNVYVVWTQSLTSGGNTEIFVATSNDNGHTFNSTAKTVELTTSLTAYSSDIPYIATYGNNAYIIWHAVATSNSAQSVWVSSSTNAGVSWSAPIQLDARSGQADEPQIAAWGNYVYATWDRTGAWFDVSSNNGASWSPPVNLNPGSRTVPAGLVREPWIAASGTNVYVSWNDNSGYGTTLGAIYDPYVMVSNNNGQTWNQNAPTKGVKLNLMPMSSSSWEIQDKAVGNTVYVYWRDHTPAYTTNGDVLMLMSTDAGTTWTPSIGSAPMDVSNDNQITGWSDGIGVSGSTVAFAYLSDCVTGQQEPSPNSGNGDCGMMVSYSNNGGQTFFQQVNVSNDRTAGPVTDDSSSNFAVSGTDVFVAWQDEPSTTFQVYFSMTTGTVVQPTTFSITPVKGAVGTTVTVTGNNFAVSKPITIQINGVAVPTSPSSIISNSTGGFSAMITIPAETAGSQTISATDGTTSSSKNFNVVPNISLSPVKGGGGTTVTITGTGFAGSSPVTITFGTFGQVTTSTTNGVGNFTASFSAPGGTAGLNTVTATDGSSNSATANFNVVTKITITPVKGTTGSMITVTGTGFAISSTIVVSYDGVAQTSTLSNGTGGFIASFAAPASTAGSNTVAGSDGTNSATATYKVLPTLSITPKSSAGKNDLSVMVTGSGYAANSMITITFNGVTQTTTPTTVMTDGTGSFTASFIVPKTTPIGSYTVQATDGSGNSDATPPTFKMN